MISPQELRKELRTIILNWTRDEMTPYERTKSLTLADVEHLADKLGAYIETYPTKLPGGTQ